VLDSIIDSIDLDAISRQNRQRLIRLVLRLTNHRSVLDH
jgi:hypothetical protein